MHNSPEQNLDYNDYIDEDITNISPMKKSIHKSMNKSNKLTQSVNGIRFKTPIESPIITQAKGIQNIQQHKFGADFNNIKSKAVQAIKRRKKRQTRSVP